MKRKALMAVVLLMLASLALPARADDTCVSTPPGNSPLGTPWPKDTACAGAFVASGPQAQTAGFLTPVVVTVAGGPLTYVNIDIVGHNVVSCAPAFPESCVTGPDTQPWCYLYEDVAL